MGLIVFFLGLRCLGGSAVLVSEARLVADELVRVAILWNEMWHDGLDEASRKYTANDIDGMFGILQPMHVQLYEMGQHGTAMEKEFAEQYSEELNKAWTYCCA